MAVRETASSSCLKTIQPFGSGDCITLTGPGFAVMEAQGSGGAPAQQAFIAMWFDPSVKEAAKAIDSAVTETGYTLLCIDQKEHGNKIE